MKNKLLGFAIITSVCIVAYAVFTFTPFTKNLNVADFFIGFTIGVGSVTNIAVVVLLIKQSKEKTSVE
jgi:hypothetical protein